MYPLHVLYDLICVDFNGDEELIVQKCKEKGEGGNRAYYNSIWTVYRNDLWDTIYF